MTPFVKIPSASELEAKLLQNLSKPSLGIILHCNLHNSWQDATTPPGAEMSYEHLHSAIQSSLSSIFSDQKYPNLRFVALFTDDEPAIKITSRKPYAVAGKETEEEQHLIPLHHYSKVSFEEVMNSAEELKTKVSKTKFILHLNHCEALVPGALSFLISSFEMHQKNDAIAQPSYIYPNYVDIFSGNEIEFSGNAIINPWTLLTGQSPEPFRISASCLIQTKKFIKIFNARQELERKNKVYSLIGTSDPDIAFHRLCSAHAVYGTHINAPLFKIASSTLSPPQNHEFKLPSLLEYTLLTQRLKVENFIELKRKHLPEVSVIIPFHNGNPAWFQEALASLDEQTFVDFEIIIIDDSSEKLSPEIIDYFAFLIPNGHFYIKDGHSNSVSWLGIKSGIPHRLYKTRRNLKLQSVRNVGAYLARGKFLVYLDPDDFIAIDTIEKMVLKASTVDTSLSAPKKVSYIYPYIRHVRQQLNQTIEAVNTTKQVTTNRQHQHQHHHNGIEKEKVELEEEIITGSPFKPYKLLSENFIPSFALIPKDVFLKAGGNCPNIAYFEDWDFWLRLLALGRSGAAIPEPLFTYRRHAFGQSSKFYREAKQNEFLAEVRKNNPIPFGDPIDPLSFASELLSFFETASGSSHDPNSKDEDYDGIAIDDFMINLKASTPAESSSSSSFVRFDDEKLYQYNWIKHHMPCYISLISSIYGTNIVDESNLATFIKPLSHILFSSHLRTIFSHRQKNLYNLHSEKVPAFTGMKKNFNWFPQPDLLSYTTDPVEKNAITRVMMLIPSMEIGGADYYDLYMIKILKLSRAFHVTLVVEKNNFHHHPLEPEFRKYCNELIYVSNLLSSTAVPHDVNSLLMKESVYILMHLVLSRRISTVYIRNSLMGYELAKQYKTLSSAIKLDMSVSDKEVDPVHFVDALHLFGSDSADVKKNPGWEKTSLPYHPYLDYRLMASRNLFNKMNSYIPKNYTSSTIKILQPGIDTHLWDATPHDVPIKKDNNNNNNNNDDISRYVTVVFIGRLVKQKAPLKFVDICKQLSKDFDDMLFLMIGDGEFYDVVTERISRYGLNKQFRQIRHLKPGKLHSYLYHGLTLSSDNKLVLAGGTRQGKTILVIPSENEGIPLVALQSLAMGVPVVSSFVGAMEDLLKEASLLSQLASSVGSLPSNDLESFVANIKQIANELEASCPNDDAAMECPLRKPSPTFREKYSLPTFKQNILTLYRFLAAHSKTILNYNRKQLELFLYKMMTETRREYLDFKRNYHTQINLPNQKQEQDEDEEYQYNNYKKHHHHNHNHHNNDNDK